uniref:Uncharacterized protein n=1 Tax=Anguilla anguilla TaxID=7936 RepID=A0A0E9Q931_ANGAN
MYFKEYYILLHSIFSWGSIKSHFTGYILPEYTYSYIYFKFLILALR